MTTWTASQSPRGNFANGTRSIPQKEKNKNFDLSNIVSSTVTALFSPGVPSLVSSTQLHKSLGGKNFTAANENVSWSM